MGIYDATKAALLAFTRTLACEEAAHGVRANAVCPGSTLTDFHLKRGQAAGIHCGSAAYAKRAIKMGFKLVTISNEVGLMVNAAKAAIKEARG